MPNQYVNKVQQSNGTVLIDITDTTAVASDVATGKYFYLATGEKVEGTSSGGGTPAISVVDTTDSHGGTVRTITALDISDTTAEAGDVAQGKYFYTAQGVKTAGTGSGGSSGQSKTGTFTGNNGLTVQIPCSFEPDLIRVYGDLSGNVSLRGIISLTFIKNDSMYILSDTSSSSSSEDAIYWVSYDMVGFNDSSSPHASYANGVLTIDMVTNTSSLRFASGVTYTYNLSTLP